MMNREKLKNTILVIIFIGLIVFSVDMLFFSPTCEEFCKSRNMTFLEWKRYAHDDSRHSSCICNTTEGKRESSVLWKSPLEDGIL